MHEESYALQPDIEPLNEFTNYVLDKQIGYQLRLANQQHLEIFSEFIPWLTPTQFSVMARLYETGSASQNELGRSVGIDAATTNGVIDRLSRKGYVRSEADAQDKRRLRISLTNKGRQSTLKAIPLASHITKQTVKNLTLAESERLSQLLGKLQKN